MDTLPLTTQEKPRSRLAVALDELDELERKPELSAPEQERFRTLLELQSLLSAIH
jgi:hypothetical protein